MEAVVGRKQACCSYMSTEMQAGIPGSHLATCNRLHCATVRMKRESCFVYPRADKPVTTARDWHWGDFLGRNQELLGLWARPGSMMGRCHLYGDRARWPPPAAGALMAVVWGVLRRQGRLLHIKPPQLLTLGAPSSCPSSPLPPSSSPSSPSLLPSCLPPSPRLPRPPRPPRPPRL